MVEMYGCIFMIFGFMKCFDLGFELCRVDLGKFELVVMQVLVIVSDGLWHGAMRMIMEQKYCKHMYYQTID